MASLDLGVLVRLGILTDRNTKRSHEMRGLVINLSSKQKLQLALNLVVHQAELVINYHP